MNIIVIIPALNEEASIESVIRSVPRKIPGITGVRVLVYDDGSVDRTTAIAKKAGADLLFRHPRPYGLARTFKDALHEALRAGADIIVNTDADNQYDQKEITQLVRPIIDGAADFVIGDRQVKKLDHMPWAKKYGNMIGSYAIRLLVGTSVSDASSGFRAFTSELARSVNILSDHTYTHEMIIDAHFKHFRIANVPITFRRRTNGISRLISHGVVSHLLKSASTIIRTVLLYEALKVLSITGGLFVSLGLVGIGRFLYLSLLTSEGSKGHIQSLVISSILIVIGFNVVVLGLIADLISYNRRLTEELKREQNSK
ncbi:MAG: glycosyltransferase family 2 protein [Patescibacteria group bacterium]|jgi:glycosyltransferase involved in cell wall biosynthesis